MSLRADDVTWDRGGSIVVDGVSIRPDPGQTVGLLGPNGAGKSSLLRLLGGLARPTAGTVALDDADLRSLRRRDIARTVAFVSQHADTDINMSVRDIVRLGRIPHRGMFGPDHATDDLAVASALVNTGLDDKADRLWQHLSGGERQRTQIARALAQNPRVLLLDEPTNHLDIHHQLEVLALVNQLPITSIIALHDLNLAALFCDHLLVLRDGRVVAGGTPREVLTPAMIADVYQVRADIITDESSGRFTIRYEPGPVVSNSTARS